MIDGMRQTNTFKSISLGSVSLSAAHTKLTALHAFCVKSRLRSWLPFQTSFRSSSHHHFSTFWLDSSLFLPPMAQTLPRKKITGTRCKCSLIFLDNYLSNRLCFE